jgi:flavin-binding protein dodecin
MTEMDAAAEAAIARNRRTKRQIKLAAMVARVNLTAAPSKAAK